MIIFITAVLFLLLHRERATSKIISQISIILGFIPVLIHEVGHALIARLTGSHVQNIYMVLTPRGQDKTGAQGLAKIMSTSRISNILSTFSGYLFPPVMLGLGIWSVDTGNSLIYMLIILLLLGFYYLHTSQKYLPVVFIVILIAFGINQSDLINFVNNLDMSVVYNILMGLLLGETVQSVIITSKIYFKNSKTDWDGAALRRLTLIPAGVFWAVWTAISAYMVYYTGLTLTQYLV